MEILTHCSGFLERWYRGVFKILWHPSQWISFCLKRELDFGNPEFCRWRGLLWRWYWPHLLIHKLVTAQVTGGWRVHGKGRGQGEPYKVQWGRQVWGYSQTQTCRFWWTHTVRWLIHSPLLKDRYHLIWLFMLQNCLIDKAVAHVCFHNYLNLLYLLCAWRGNCS